MPRPARWPGSAPPWLGEPEAALWHFSEDPTLREFTPRLSRLEGRPLVWAIDSRHSPLFWFPRECPRITFWPVATTTSSDRIRFFGQTAAHRIHAIEAASLGSVRECRLFVYRMPPASFAPAGDTPGYWVAESVVSVGEPSEVGDLLSRHAAAGIEFRVMPSLWPLWHDVIRSTLGFSGSRLANTTVPRPAGLLPV